MHILAFILIFIVGSIIAACDGDYSGIAAIGKFVGIFCITIRSIMAITSGFMIIAIVVLVLIVIGCSAK